MLDNIKEILELDITLGRLLLLLIIKDLIENIVEVLL